MKFKILIFFTFTVFVVAFRSSSNLSIIDKKVDFGFKVPDSTRNIYAIIIHSTYNVAKDSFSVQGCINQFKRYDVSAHYIIGRDGKIYRLVDEKNISYHAGKSTLPDGSSTVNTNSIGIEIITTKYTSPTQEQYDSVVSLVKDIKSRYAIKYMQGHDQIAPGRKTDPWNFDWTKFNSMLAQ